MNYCYCMVEHSLCSAEFDASAGCFPSIFPPETLWIFSFYPNAYLKEKWPMIMYVAIGLLNTICFYLLDSSTGTLPFEILPAKKTISTNFNLNTSTHPNIYAQHMKNKMIIIIIINIKKKKKIGEKKPINGHFNFLVAFKPCKISCLIFRKACSWPEQWKG